MRMEIPGMPQFLEAPSGAVPRSSPPAADGIAPCLLRQLIPGQAFPSFWSASRLPSWIFKVALMKILGMSVALRHFIFFFPSFHFVGSPIHRFAESLALRADGEF